MSPPAHGDAARVLDPLLAMGANREHWTFCGDYVCFEQPAWPRGRTGCSRVPNAYGEPSAPGERGTRARAASLSFVTTTGASSTTVAASVAMAILIAVL